MPFNGSGIFSVINVFIPNTTILSAAVNQNYSDIATGLSDVLTRDGQAGMTAALGLINGTSGAPSLTANSDAKSGLYFPAGGVVALVANALGLQVNSETFGALSATIAAGGTGYAVGDTIYEAGGTFAIRAIFTVATVSGGVVTGVTATVPGIYTAKPSNPVSQIFSSGTGTGCTLTITWNDPTSSAFQPAILNLSNALLWQSLGASSYVSTLFGYPNATDFATVGIGSAALVSAISGSFTFTPQGYLTPTSNTPIITGDVTAATSLFYTPYVGNMIPIYNGTILVQKTFTQMQCTLTSGAQAVGGIYDIYCFNNAGTLTLGFSPTWAAGTSGSVTAGACARGTGTGGTALARIGGIWTNAVAMTVNNSSSTFSVPINQGTYLGSIYINGTAGQLNLYRGYGQSRAWDIWNAYNRAPIYLKAGDGTASWTYATATWRPANNASTNSLIIFSGLAEEIYDIANEASVTLSGGGSLVLNPLTGIGFNSTTAPTGKIGTGTASGSTGLSYNTYAHYVSAPSLGINVITALEDAIAGTNTFNGTETYMLLSAKWRG